MTVGNARGECRQLSKSPYSIIGMVLSITLEKSLMSRFVFVEDLNKSSCIYNHINGGFVNLHHKKTRQSESGADPVSSQAETYALT